MKIIDVKSTPVMKNPHNVKTGMIYNTEHAMVVHLCLEPGEKLKRHITPTDVFFYILEGEALIEIGEEKEKVSADHLVESPAGIPHCIYNENGSTARILVVKVPRPVDKTIIL